MKKKNIKLLVVLACVLMALGMSGCGKKAYKTFPEKYKLASVDVGGMTADEAKKAIKTAVGKYKLSVKLDDASFDMTAEDLGLKYNDKADLQELINAANKDKEPEKQVKLFKMDKSDELETALVDSYITAKDADGNEIGTFDNKMKGTKTEGDRTYDSDIVIYRLAEMYLFKAEAYAALNQTPQAIIELNRVRDRAKIGTYSGSTNKIAVEKEILNERARELYLERKRWPDLLRFHYGGTIDVYQEVPNLKKKVDDNIIIPLYLAIPLSDININPNLKQTQGYENL